MGYFPKDTPPTDRPTLRVGDDEVPTITEPAEFHRKLIRGEWTSCATDEVFPFIFGMACGKWGGEL